MGTRDNLLGVSYSFRMRQSFDRPPNGVAFSPNRGYSMMNGFPPVLSFRSTFMALLVAGLVLFLVTHLIRPFAPGLRAAGIARIGKPGWMTLHGLASLASLAMIVCGFVMARDSGGEMLYTPPTFMAHIALTLMLIASICFVAGLLPAGHIRTRLKFPVLVSVKIWALAHLLANGESYSVLLFVTILAWAVVLRISLKKRIASGETLLPVFVSARYDIMAAAAGLVLYLAIVLKLHEWLIGVSPMA